MNNKLQHISNKHIFKFQLINIFNSLQYNLIGLMQFFFFVLFQFSLYAKEFVSVYIKFYFSFFFNLNLLCFEYCYIDFEILNKLKIKYFVRRYTSNTRTCCSICTSNPLSSHRSDLLNGLLLLSLQLPCQLYDKLNRFALGLINHNQSVVAVVT